MVDDVRIPHAPSAMQGCLTRLGSFVYVSMIDGIVIHSSNMV